MNIEKEEIVIGIDFHFLANKILKTLIRHHKMGASFIPILFFTAVWGGVGIGMPMMTPKGPHQSLIRCILMLTAATCWLFWLCCYMAQMNPLIGPKLSQHAIYMVARNWGSPLEPH